MGIFSFFEKIEIGSFIEKKPNLPQNLSVKQREKQQKEVKERQKKYSYTYSTFIRGAPRLEVLPKEEFPNHLWFEKTLKSVDILLGEVGNQIFSELREHLIDDQSFRDFLIKAKDLKFFLWTTSPSSSPSLQDYIDLIQDPKNTPSIHELDSDEAFCRYRLAGPNPLQLEPCSLEQFHKFAWKGIDTYQRQQIFQMYEKGCLYICDYSQLNKFHGSIHHGNEKFSFGPMALFTIPENRVVASRQSILPICIQLEEMKRYQPLPTIFFPQDGIAWKIAKIFVNSADAVYHEGVVHLAHTHLISEVFLVATYRTLPSKHPLFVLLEPHFEGTAFINTLANEILVRPGTILDQLLGQDIDQLDAYVGKQVGMLLNKNLTFPERLKQRQMDETSFPVPYPYRDDGMILWKSIYKWVDYYLDIYYKSDLDIQKDKELTQWIRELRSSNGGNVGWLKQWNQSRKMLKDLVSSILFTASVQHAAVNFPQQPLMAYAPAFPFGIYDDTMPIKNQDEQQLMKYLPPLPQAKTQSTILHLLGSVHYTTLGHYPSEHFRSIRARWGLRRFQKQLKECQKIIEKRNQKRVEQWNGILSKKLAQNWAYTFMLPQYIPQSINI